MKRENDGEGYKVMKKDHFEKDMGKTMVADLKYCGNDPAAELKGNVDKLANYVKKNEMKHY